MTTKRNGIPMKVSPDFKEWAKDFQIQMRIEKGLNPSFTELTRRIIQSPKFEDVEKTILSQADDIPFNMRMDRRKNV